MEKAIKKLGQNFLKDKNIVFKMVDVLDITLGDTVIEIGPGPGVFTVEIAKNVNTFKSFYAIELDSRFANKLKNELGRFENIHIINENFLDWVRENSFENCKVLGSIPYYITSPIIHSLIKMHIQPNIIVLMMQKEVAEKISEKGVKPNYLSNFVKTFYDVEYLETVEKEKFTPVPKVDSAVLKLVKKENVFIKNITNYENFLHKGFKTPKKMLNKVFNKEFLEQSNIKGTDRPHNIDVDSWVKIYKEMYEV